MTDNVRRMDDHLLDKWRISMRAQGRSPRTIERVQTVRRCADYCRTPAHLLSADDLTEWFASLHIEQSSRNTYLRSLKAWFRWLVLDGVREDDPTLLLGTFRVPRAQPRPLSTEELELVLASRMRRKTRAMILLAAYQGLRVGEISKMRGELINHVSGKLLVHGKGDVKLNPPLHDVTRNLSQTMPRRGLWFPSPKYPNQPIDPRSTSDIIGRAIKRAGVEGSAHQLRHWFGTELLRGGADLRIVQELMRHADPRTTAIYTQVNDDQQREAIQVLPKVA